VGIGFGLISANTMRLSWPSDHLGWTLLSNSVSVANASFWYPVPGSSTVTNLDITLNPSATNVFFRLIYPYP
jgi:hypothetical protein